MHNRTPEFDLCLFGGNGDLALRKLLPALYYCELDKAFNPIGRIIGIARTGPSQEEYLAQVHAAIQQHVPELDYDETVWQQFAQRIEFIGLDIANRDDYKPVSYTHLTLPTR